MKIIERNLPWSNKIRWAWPERDDKLIQVFDQVNDIDRIMKHVDGNQVCVQAGGACGMWPLRYADFFETVYTFEPVRENYECLKFNTYDASNIKPYPVALSDKEAIGKILLHPSEQGNAGAGYFEVGVGDVTSITIDGFNLEACDLIQLDVEGHELEALKGAEHTIEKYSPVIVIEEKPLPQMEDDYRFARIYIETQGYEEIDRIHRDVIFRKKL